MSYKSEETDNNLQVVDEKIQNELIQSRNALKELAMMLNQTQTELSRLTQRNQAVTNHLNLIQAQFDSSPREEIRSAYDNALDAQYRLLVLRGQLEKLQSEQASSQRMIDFYSSLSQSISDCRKMNLSDLNGPGEITYPMVVQAEEAVRERLLKQMHDGPAQALSNFILRVEIANRLFDVDPKRAKEELNELKNEASVTFGRIKNFIYDLKPMILEDMGLVPALRKYFEALKEQSGTNINLNIPEQERRYEPYLEMMLFRTIQEILAIIIRHNLGYPVKITIDVALSLEDDQVSVSVKDNGKGFGTDKLMDNGNLGIQTVQERIERIGGQWNMTSSTGNGCVINFSVPAII